MSPAVRAALGRFRSMLVLLVLLAPSLAAQERFDKAEFAARRARLLERIPDGIAIVLALVVGIVVFRIRRRQLRAQ